MSTLSRDDLGFVRGHRYERVSGKDLEALLSPEDGEQIYMSGVRGGVRTAEPVTSDGEVDVKPGDTFSVGPRITKAAAFGPPHLHREVQALQRSGFGSVNPPVKTAWGWEVRLHGLTLPDGKRTDAMVLLPLNYPLASPIGFYLRENADTGKLDRSHLFPQTYHGAVDRSVDGWHWFCGIPSTWTPGRHTLITYLSIVLALFNEQGGS